ncbi:MAG: hypothetical protein GX130_07800 [Candidatus Hydrogenedens sp.]|jgi:Tat protein translocase TatB subunit|nr:hypothetical protein [Candidatus Hydrogenedens sp.]
MLGIGIGEMIIIAGIALMVIGPDKFPEFAKIVVRTIRDLRGYVEEIQTEVTKELAPIKKEIDKLNTIKPEEYIDNLMTEKSEKVAGQSELDHTNSADPTDRQHDGSGSHPSADSTPPPEETQDQQDSSPVEDAIVTDDASPAETESVHVPVEEDTPEASVDTEDRDTVASAEEDDFDNISPPERLD